MQELKLVKELAFGDHAKSQLLTGVEKLTNAVGSTLGAGGKCVILEDNNGKPMVTKDGVTVANSITLRNPIENIGATLLKQAAQQTVKDAGDGTTTATILAKAILDEADKHSLLDDVRLIKEGINLGVDKVISYLEDKATKVSKSKIEQVATISANNDNKLGKLISKAFNSIDKYGSVMLETNSDPESIVDIVDGLEYDQGLKTNHFANNKENDACILENPLVLISESKIDNIRQIQRVLEYAIQNKKSLLIIADVDYQVYSALAMNKMKGNIKVNVIDGPTYGINQKIVLDNLSLITKAKVFNQDLGDDLDLINEDDLGTCLKVSTFKNNTIFKIDIEKNEKLKNSIKTLKSKKNKTEAVRRKISQLTGKLAIVKIGADSEVELKEKKDRAEDAICATRAAINEGILPGGGIALLNASHRLKPKSIGEEVLYCAIRKPFEIIMQNAGIQYDNIPNKEGIGYNVVTGKTVDMVQAGIIDPLLVTKSALKNAASVATTILSTDCIINNIRNESGR
tara:strand:+ start:19 stop:1560 length:1542 start_codon:yes stop_codon:yes gene_type:complete